MEYTFIDENIGKTNEYCSYIHINNTSLSIPLCNEIIKRFETDKDKYDGISGGFLDKDRKHTMDLVIPDNEEWIKIKRAIHKELITNLDCFLDNLNEKFKDSNLNIPSKLKYKFFKGLRQSSIPTFMIQRYTKNIGKFVYHDDSLIEVENNQTRIITFLWYLNDIDEGGETVFSDKFAVKPTRGKLVLFPANWSYPHCGKVPLSDDKYIITGWVYMPL